MEAYTLDRNFLREDVVDRFDSLIWTERYYGDSEVEITAPATPSNIDLLAENKFLEIPESKEIMLLETHDIKDGVLKVNGISLLKWTNNRFVRTSAAHEDRYWNIEGYTADQTLSHIVTEMLIYPGPTGIPNPERFLITGLSAPLVDSTEDPITIAVPYGPLYNALYEIAQTYEVGMTLVLDHADSTGYQLRFATYKGLDRTSTQSANPIVRFSPDMESLTDIQELRTVERYKTEIWSFVPPNPDGLASVPGLARVSDTLPTQFDLRTSMLFVEDVTTDQVGGSGTTMTDILNQRAAKALTENSYVAQVDGEIVPTSQFQYGSDYSLGDIVEIAGHSKIVQPARITEYIRSQDASGEKEYPTLTLIV